MSLLSIAKGFGVTIAKGAAKHSAAISAVTQVACLAGSIYFSWKARPVVEQVMTEERAKREELEMIFDKGGVPEDEYKKIKKEITRETVKRLAPALIPITLCAVVGTGLSVRTAIVCKKKDRTIQNLESLATVVGTSANEFVKKTKEVVGEEKVKEIENEIAKDKVEAGELTIAGALQAKGGDKPFYDKLGARLILSDKKTIRGVVDQMNTEMSYAIIPSPSTSYARFCELMNLPAPAYADKLIWTKRVPDDRLEVHFKNALQVGDVAATAIEWMDAPTLDTSNGMTWR